MTVEQRLLPYFGPSWSKKIYEAMGAELIDQVGQALGYLASVDATTFPAQDDIFKAFRTTSYEQARVIVIGQDPYPNGHADGLAFSSSTRELPFSLGAILREVDRDLNLSYDAEGFCKNFTTWSLEEWAIQGVLLINSSLSVEKDKPGSHSALWRDFVWQTLYQLSLKDEPMVWMAWGHSAISILPHIDEDKHLLLTAGHPAAAAYGTDRFSGCKHFSKANRYLQDNGLVPIDWRLSPREEVNDSWI